MEQPKDAMPGSLERLVGHSDSETPRTDSAVLSRKSGALYDEACQLERDLETAREELYRLRDVVGEVDVANIDLVLSETQRDTAMPNDKAH
jgi:hypothetical protein